MRANQIGKWFAACVLIADLVLGGATRQGYLGDAIIELFSLPLLGFAIYKSTGARQDSYFFGWALAGVAAVMAAPLVQLIPLPPAIWSALPGRAPIVSGFVQAEIALPWLPLSVSPETTTRSFFATIPPLSIFLATAVFGMRTRLTLAAIIIIVAVLSVVLGLAQVATGADSALRFYEVTNAEQAVGFFANRNHFSALLYSALPLLGGVGFWLHRTKQATMEALVAMFGSTYAVLLIGIALAASRAGLFLGFLACLGVAMMALPDSERVRSALRRIWILVLPLSTITMLLVFQGYFSQIDQTLTGDARVAIARSALAAARAFFPVGSGFGTFVPVYQMFEKPNFVTGEYINRAHDDWLELLIESGVLGVALAVGFLAWYAFAVRELHRQRQTEAGQNLSLILAQASCWIIGLIALHSLVDYPLRTSALSCIFGFACGCLVQGPVERAVSIKILNPVRRGAGKRNAPRSGHSR